MARGRPSKKAHIVNAACGLFAKQGYQSTSVDQVVLAAEVSKPTVYSNFPTKLVLWETVLESRTERAKDEMSQTLSRLKSASDFSSDTTMTFVSGWIALWETWVDKPENLAVYRTLLGERHKMKASTIALFDQFETVLEFSLQDWLTTCEQSSESFFVLKAVMKEALLMPALLDQKQMSARELSIQLENLINNKA
jgi:AcrR family transcriptional regulator